MKLNIYQVKGGRPLPRGIHPCLETCCCDLLLRQLLPDHLFLAFSLANDYRWAWDSCIRWAKSGFESGRQMVALKDPLIFQD